MSSMRERLVSVLRQAGFKYHDRCKSDRNEIYKKGSKLVYVQRTDVFSEAYVRSVINQVGLGQKELIFVLNPPPQSNIP